MNREAIMAESLQPSAANPSYEATAPVAVLISSCSERAASTERAMEEAGIRTRAVMTFADAGLELHNQGALDVIVIEAMSAPNDLLEAVLARADAMAQAGPANVVAMVAIEQLDAAYSHLLSRNAQLLCAPNESDRAAALACARAEVTSRKGGGGARPVLDDARREGEVARLRRLNE